jgi:hypothetical protein
MPKAKHTPSPAEQRKRFEAEVQRLINAGDLDPEKADEALDRLVRKARAEPS